MTRKIILIIAAVILFISCDDPTKRVVPPDGAVNRVMDFYMFDDNSTFLYLTSNMNRRYDYGMLVMMEIDEDGDPVYVDSITTPSLGGKIAVDEDKGFIYVTSRDLHGIVRIKISGKEGNYRLSYTDDTDGYHSDVLKTEKEPYAVTFSLDKSKLYVTHLLNGEFTAIDLDKWEKIDSFKLKYGVTDIIFDPTSEYFIASHRSSGFITLIDPVQTLSEFHVGISEIEMDVPVDSYDIRSLGLSADGQSIYAAFRNVTEDSDEDSSPQLLEFAIKDDGTLTTEVIRSIPLQGALGELAVLPYTTGADDNEYNGELVFITSPEEKKVSIVDSGHDTVIEEITFDKKCEPYQIYVKKTGDATGIVFVSCYVQDRIVLYDVDVTKKDFITEEGVIE
jgi:DNA-binding beta-propeller fold protein YncE